MAYRKIQGLQEVRFAESPFGAKARRPRGAKGLGLRFESSVAKALPAAQHGQWFRFVDNNGPGFCQPDLLFSHEGSLCIAECKLTDCAEADGQMRELYLPLLRALWDGPIHPIVVVKYLSPLTLRSRVVHNWAEALAHPSPVLHGFSKRELTPQEGQIFPPSFSRSCYSYGVSAMMPQIP